MDIREDALESSDVIQLLHDHLEEMALHSPPESMHALDLQHLRHPDVSFWTIWEGAELLGCGALKRLESDHAEIKSMRTAYRHRGKGVAQAMLLFVIEEAKRRGIKRLSLETGSMDGFISARRLYEAHGFQYCDPFVGYVEDPYSVFMTKMLQFNSASGTPWVNHQVFWLYSYTDSFAECVIMVAWR